MAARLASADRRRNAEKARVVRSGTFAFAKVYLFRPFSHTLFDATTSSKSLSDMVRGKPHR